jgi:hypothetical protein
MLGNEGNRNGAANGSGQEEGSGSEFPVDTPSSGSSESTIAENEITDGVSDVHVSDETAVARRRDEYDVDFE